MTRTGWRFGLGFSSSFNFGFSFVIFCFIFFIFLALAPAPLTQLSPPQRFALANYATLNAVASYRAG